jgi:hypothetical protein
MVEAVAIPALVIASIVFLVGIVGNCVVCYVCGCRLLSKSVVSNFVLALAAVDLVGCLVCVPMEIAQLINR